MTYQEVFCLLFAESPAELGEPRFIREQLIKAHLSNKRVQTPFLVLECLVAYLLGIDHAEDGEMRQLERVRLAPLRCILILVKDAMWP